MQKFQRKNWHGMEGGGAPPPPSSPSWIEFTYNTGNYQDVVHSIYVDEKVSLNLNTDIFCDPHHKEIRKHLTNGQNYRTPRSIEKIFNTLESFHNKSFFYSGCKKFWVVQSSFPIVTRLNKVYIKKKAKFTSIFDFSYLYATIDVNSS